MPHQSDIALRRTICTSCIAIQHALCAFRSGLAGKSNSATDSQKPIGVSHDINRYFALQPPPILPRDQIMRRPRAHSRTALQEIDAANRPHTDTVRMPPRIGPEKIAILPTRVHGETIPATPTFLITRK